MALLQSVCNGYGWRFAVKGIPFMGSLFYIYPKIAVCALRCCGMFAALLADRQQRNGRPSAAVGADLSCPYPRNCKKTCCVVRWFHSAIIVGNDEEAGAINRSPTPHGVHVEGIAQHK